MIFTEENAQINILHSIPAAVSLNPVEKTYLPGSTIMFTNIKTSNGLDNTHLTDIRNKGFFTCVNDGLYRISVSLLTNTAQGRVILYKNGSVMNIIYMHDAHNADVDHTTFDSLVRLSKGDTIIIKASSTLYVYGKTYSVLSVLQITK